MSNNLDNLIAEKEAEFSAFRSKMDVCREQFIKESANFASVSFKNIAKEYTARFCEHCLRMQEEKRLDFKNAVIQLVQDSEAITRIELGRRGLWWHLEPYLFESSEKYKIVAEKYPDIVDRSVRRILGHLGIILENYGFRVTASGKTSTFFEFWFERPVITEAAIPSYPHLLTWTENMRNIIQQYDTYYRPALKCFKNLKDLTDEKKKNQALTLWNDF
jgi:hypothetical protein